MLLVVDDHHETRYVIERLLRADGYETTGVSCGRDALRFLKTHTPRLVVLDYHMPDMEGLEVFREMRKDRRLDEVKVIMFSAHAGDLRKEALAAGVDGYVKKGSLYWEKLLAEIVRLVGPGTSAPKPLREVATTKITKVGDLVVILVVACHPDTRDALVPLISSRGYKVAAVDCGEGAIKQLCFHTASLVVLNCGVPDSFNVLAEIRSEANVPSTIVVMFSSDEQDLKEKALLLGADGYVPKGSLDWAELLQEIERLAGPPW